MKAARMKERPTFALMKQTDIQSIYHMQMPRWLFSDPRYADMSLDAKVAYTFLLNRFQLSRRNGWVNEFGEVFVIFPRKALAKELRVCEQRVTAAFKTLVQRSLVWEKRCGRGDANQIYLANVEPMEDRDYECAPFQAPERGSRNADLAPLEEPEGRADVQEPQDTRLQGGRIRASRTAGPAVPEPQDPRPSYTEKSNTDLSHMEVSPSVKQTGGAADGEEELAGILEGCELFCFEPATARVFENAIERLFYSDSYRIGNATLPQCRVRAKLRLLDGMVLREAESKLYANRDHTVRNSTAYTMATIFNCIAESESDLMVDPYLNSLRTPKGGMMDMLLSIQQKYILGVLRKLGCLRRDQILRLAVRNLKSPGSDQPITGEWVETILRQLRHCVNDVRLEEDVIRLSHVDRDKRKLEAIDVMLEISEAMPENYGLSREPPALLRFSLGGDSLRFFTVSQFSALALRAAGDSVGEEVERTIWISEDGSIPEGLVLPSGHFFAVRQADGTHRFFGGDES